RCSHRLRRRRPRRARGTDGDRSHAATASLRYAALRRAMIPAKVRETLTTLAGSLDTLPGLDDELRARWRDGVRADLPRDLRAAADELNVALAPLTLVDDDAQALGALFSSPEGEVLRLWCSSNAWRRDVAMARLLSAAPAEQR